MWAESPSVALCTFLRCDAIAAERKVHRFVRRPKVKLLSESKPVTYVRKGPVYTCARSRLPEGSALRTASHCSAPPFARLGSARLCFVHFSCRSPTNARRQQSLPSSEWALHLQGKTLCKKSATHGGQSCVRRHGRVRTSQYYRMRVRYRFGCTTPTRSSLSCVGEDRSCS